jgi:hypothetical protein
MWKTKQLSEQLSEQLSCQPERPEEFKDSDIPGKATSVLLQDVSLKQSSLVRVSTNFCGCYFETCCHWKWSRFTALGGRDMPRVH